MGWTPNLNPLVCPFCGKACDVPSEEAKAVRLQRTSGFDADRLRASCGCGANVVVDTEIDTAAAELHRWARAENREIGVYTVHDVNFVGPFVAECAAPRELEGEWDGEWVDALFYRLIPRMDD